MKQILKNFSMSEEEIKNKIDAISPQELEEFFVTEKSINKCYTVKRLKEELDQFPDDMKVTITDDTDETSTAKYFEDFEIEFKTQTIFENTNHNDLDCSYVPNRYDACNIKIKKWRTGCYYIDRK